MANKRFSRDAKCIVMGATMAVCALSLCSWVRAPRIVRQVPTMAAYKAYYDAAEDLIEQMRMDADPYGDIYDYADYVISKSNLKH